MGLTLREANGVQALAGVMQDFLPGSGSKKWKAHVNLGSVARDVGVGDFWDPEGSKGPRLKRLFERTLTHRRHLFEKLVVTIVKEGLQYRNKKGDPIRPKEIKEVNGHLVEIGFKFPNLWDTSFLDALKVDDNERAARNVASVEQRQAAQASEGQIRRAALDALRRDLEQLFGEPNRQKAGLALEGLLSALFKLFGLDPRAPFRVVGEQIDGSFELDHDVYLLEAKWENAPTPEADLLIFRGKIEGKSAHTRGVFIAMNGISEEARTAITTGKQALFFVVNGHDLMMVLQGNIRLDDFLRQRRRLLAEEGAVTAPFSRIRS